MSKTQWPVYTVRYRETYPDAYGHNDMSYTLTAINAEDAVIRFKSHWKRRAKIKKYKKKLDFIIDVNLVGHLNTPKYIDSPNI